MDMTSLRLPIDPMPGESRLATLAKLLPPTQWDQVRRSAYRRASYRCQGCGCTGRLYCHEVWQFNPATGYQWLRGFQALCELCHETKHITFLHGGGRHDELLQHFMQVNRLTRDEALSYVQQAHARQRELDQRHWIVNFGDYNMRVPAVRDVEARRKYAASFHPRYRA